MDARIGIEGESRKKYNGWISHLTGEAFAVYDGYGQCVPVGNLIVRLVKQAGDTAWQWGRDAQETYSMNSIPERYGNGSIWYCDSGWVLVEGAKVRKASNSTAY